MHLTKIETDIQIIGRPKRDWGWHTSAGIHMLSPSPQEIQLALERARIEGFKRIYIYSTKFSRRKPASLKLIQSAEPF